MPVYELSEEAIKTTERLVGLPIDKINSQTVEESIEYIEKKRKEPLAWTPQQSKGVQSRGNTSSARSCFRDSQAIDEDSHIITDRGRN